MSEYQKGERTPQANVPGRGETVRAGHSTRRAPRPRVAAEGLLGNVGRPSEIKNPATLRGPLV